MVSSDIPELASEDMEIVDLDTIPTIRTLHQSEQSESAEWTRHGQLIVAAAMGKEVGARCGTVIR